MVIIVEITTNIQNLFVTIEKFIDNIENDADETFGHEQKGTC